jgi:hypothetical protein
MTTMALPLQTILEAELAAGNRIVEVTAWPPKCGLLVVLAKSFLTPPTLHDDVSFHQIDDTHYWNAEYRYCGGVQVLACRFD